MSYAPATDHDFLRQIEGWLSTQEEILIQIRYRCGAGSQDWELFTSFQAFSDRLRELPPGAHITAFKKPQLPLRGVVDDKFIAECLSSIAEDAEYLAVETVKRVYGSMSWFHHSAGEGHTELRGELEELRGCPVAVGVHPPVLERSEDVLQAVIPDGDGVVRAGPY